MGWARTAAREIWGLFVDDGSFAAAIAVWVAAMWAMRRWVPVSPRFSGALLFAGLGVILAESVWRFARRRRPGG